MGGEELKRKHVCRSHHETKEAVKAGGLVTHSDALVTNEYVLFLSGLKHLEASVPTLPSRCFQTPKGRSSPSCQHFLDGTSPTPWDACALYAT